MSQTGIEKREFGTTGMSIGVLGFGSMELRGEGHNKGRAISREDGARLLNTVLDLGIDFVDTSPDYGQAEERIGEAIGHRRDEYILASKCGCPLYDDPVAPRPLKHDFSRASMTEVFEQTLTRLRTDHVDLLQFHASPSRSVLEAEDSIATLLEFRDQGKVRFIGVSSEMPELAEHVEIAEFASIQLPYSAMQRGYDPYMMAAKSAGKAVIVRGGVGKGAPRDGQPLPASWKDWESAHLDDLLDGESRNDFMLRYTLAHPALSTAIVGTLSAEHLAANVQAAARGPLSPEVYDEARRRLESLTVAA